MERTRSERRHFTIRKCLRRLKFKKSIEYIPATPEKAPIIDYYADKGILVFAKKGYISCGCSKRIPGRPHCGGYGCKVHDRKWLKERRKAKRRCREMLKILEGWQSQAECTSLENWRVN